jgi:flavin reductase (DIM6/NTAB) family NADH-FMN oxidoreductase RutF
MFSVDPHEVTTARFHSLLLGAIGPRPIAFASTIDAEGNPNLSPFSFFNAFSANPPMLVFSPARRVRDNTIKHTLENVKAIPEVVINVVNYAMVQQMSLASTEYGKGVNEFEKAGFTQVASSKIRPFRVKESPVQFECIVKDVIELGDQGGAGNLILCEVIMAHVMEEVLDASQQIDQHKIDLVARMGGNWYCRAHGEALFEVEKPLTTLGIGVDALPVSIRLSPVLTGNNLGQLGNVEHIPSQAELDEFNSSGEYAVLMESVIESDFAVHHVAQHLLEKGEVMKAWKVLLLGA